jgi:hypothetical protein
MPEQGDDHLDALRALDEALVDAAGYLAGVDPDLDGGYQTAHEVLSHFVFWHREYVTISQALLEGRGPALRDGTFAQLSREATTEFAGQSMADLATSLLALQKSLCEQLLVLVDWSVDFPVKQDSRPRSVAKRVALIEQHLRDHVRRLRRAERHGQAWVKAYYPNQDR